MKHTPEPWEAIEVDDEHMAYGIICKNQPNLKNQPNDIACVWYRGGKKKTAANAARIVACVNACAGIPTEELEDHGTGGIKDWMDASDELLKAMCMAVEDVDYSGRCEQGIYVLKQQRDDLQSSVDGLIEGNLHQAKLLQAQQKMLLDAGVECGSKSLIAAMLPAHTEAKWMEVYRVQTAAIERLEQQRDELLAERDALQRICARRADCLEAIGLHADSTHLESSDFAMSIAIAKAVKYDTTTDAIPNCDKGDV